MSNATDIFLQSRLPITGLAAYSIQSPHGVLASQCMGKSLFAAAVQEMIGTVIKTGQALLPAVEPPAHYCWTFEYLRVYVALRADGSSIALLVENSPTVQTGRIQETLQAFLDLPEL